MKTRSLGEVAEIVRGVTFSKSEGSSTPAEDRTPVIRAGSIQDTLLVDHDQIWVPSGRVKCEQIIRKDDILMCTSSGSSDLVGKTARAESNWNGSFGAFCTMVRPRTSRCDPSYLFHFLRSPFFRSWTTKSSGANIKNIRSSELANFKVPIPILEEQKRIAAILDKADAIRRRRQQVIQLVDEFLRAVFLDMFGDPVTNPKRWKVKPLGELVHNLDGRRVPVRASDRGEMQGIYPYYGASGIIDYVDDYLFEERTLLIGEDGANLLARSTPIAFIAEGHYWVNNHAHVLGEKDIALDYLRYSINLRPLEQFVTGSAQPKLNQENLNSIPIQLPDSGSLKPFMSVLAKTRELQSKCSNAEMPLFESIQADAF